MRRSGYAVTVENWADFRPIKAQYQVPAELGSCHTAVIEEYVIEGHVPADLIGRFVRERPKILGLAVPGMPAGLPGMAAEGSRPELDRVYMFGRARTVGVFAREID